MWLAITSAVISAIAMQITEVQSALQQSVVTAFV
jgi:hypothetical protein